MAAKMNGVWKIKSSENFDEYMKAIGVNVALRNMGKLAKPTLTVTIDGKSFYMKSESTFKTIESKCNIDEEFDEETPDGRKCKSIYRWDGDKLVQVQKWDGKESTLTRYVEGDELVMDLVMGDIVSKRIYVRK